MTGVNMELNFNTLIEKPAVTRIRTGVAAATTQSTNHYTITARYHSAPGGAAWGPLNTKQSCLL